MGKITPRLQTLTTALCLSTVAAAFFHYERNKEQKETPEQITARNFTVFNAACNNLEKQLWEQFKTDPKQIRDFALQAGGTYDIRRESPTELRCRMSTPCKDRDHNEPYTDHQEIHIVTVPVKNLGTGTLSKNFWPQSCIVTLKTETPEERRLRLLYWKLQQNNYPENLSLLSRS